MQSTNGRILMPDVSQAQTPARAARKGRNVVCVSSECIRERAAVTVSKTRDLSKELRTSEAAQGQPG